MTRKKPSEPKSPEVPNEDIMDEEEVPFLSALRDQVQMTLLNASHGTKIPVTPVVDLPPVEPVRNARKPHKKKTGS